MPLSPRGSRGFSMDNALMAEMTSCLVGFTLMSPAHSSPSSSLHSTLSGPAYKIFYSVQRDGALPIWHTIWPPESLKYQGRAGCLEKLRDA